MEIVCKFADYEEMVGFAGKLLGREGGQDMKSPAAGSKTIEAMPAEGTKEPETSTEEPARQEEGQREYSLVDVRAKLAELQRAGKREQVKELLGSFGASKLSDVPEGEYASLMQKAGEL